MSQSSFILSFKGFTKDTVKFCLKILYFLPFIILIAAFNYLVDPANIFAGGKSERKMAEYIGNGYNVYHNANYDERITQKFIIEKNKDHPEIIVIGSSRSMGIRKNHFSGKMVFSYSH